MRWSKEGFGGLLFLVVGTYGLIFSAELGVGTWSLPGPKIFPLGLSFILVISGVFWCILGFGQKGAANVRIQWLELARKEATPLKIIGITAACILGLEPMGYLLTSALYLFALFFWVSRYKVWIAMCLAITGGLGSWYFFERVLSVQFPHGHLWF